MNWLCLFCVEAANQTWLFYGYATPADGFPAGNWQVREIARVNGVRLLQCHRFADTQTLDAFRAALGGSHSVIERHGQPPLAIEHGGLRQRPTVYAATKTFLPAGTPVSLSDQLAQIDGYWQLNPDALIAGLYAHPQLPNGERQDCLARILSRIQGETGIQIAGRDAGRLGNFEVVRYVVGSYDQPDGLVHRPERPPAGGGAAVVVWIEHPLATQAPLMVGCRMYNGHPRDLRTLVADEVQRWPPVGANTLRFTALEPISSYELSVWTEGGRFLARQDESVLRQFHGEIAIADQGAAVTTPWDESLPQNQRLRVLQATGVARQPFRVGGNAADPWVAAEDRKRTILNELGPTTGSGRFFPAGQEHHVEAILFLARLITRPGVRRVILADPYLDHAAVESLLVRVRDVPELVVLTSHDRPQPLGRKPLNVILCEALECFTRFVCRLPRGEREAVPEDSVQMLVEGCNCYRDSLPRRMRVFNLQSNEGGRGRQFHDRMVLIELGDEGRELWSLTNSIKMLARRCPVIAARMDPDVTASVAAYLGQLEAGALPGRNDLRAVLVWEKSAPALPGTGATTRPPDSPLWVDRVLSLLRPAVPPHERLQSAIRDGLLEVDVRPGTTTWRVSDATRAGVVGVITDGLHAQGADLHDVRAVATWAYHGGPQAEEYPLDERAVEALVAALTQSLGERPVPSPHRGGAHDMTAKELAPEALNAARLYVNHNAPGDLHAGSVPELDFLGEALWRLAPERLIAIEEATRSSRIAGWLAANAHGLTPMQRQAILQSNNGRLRALGVVILWDRDLDNNATAVARLDALTSDLVQAAVPPMEILLLSIVLAMQDAESVESLREQLAAALARHNGPLGEAGRARVITTLLAEPDSLREQKGLGLAARER